jgi:tetratricopeptide (TPR) repeat protein
MLYLIIPPIVVIVSLALLIWFLSNQAKQPSIQERMEDIANHSSFREWQMLRLKQVFFRFLEKSMRSLKVLSLRIHNAFHTIGQSMREKRHQSDLLVSTMLNIKKEQEELSREEPEEAVMVSSEPPIDVSSELKLRRSIPENEEKKVDVAVKTPLSAPTRPMVSERMVVPEAKKEKVVSADTEEENRLIKRIAANPKSVSAYEALGDYYLERGDANDAKSCYRQVLKLSPVHRMVKIKIRKLERLIEEQKA